MAYLDLINGRTEVAVSVAHELARQFGLTQIERNAVMLARVDRSSSLRPTGRLYRLGVICFGLRPASNALADPRLEALRRFAVAVANGSSTSVAKERKHLLSIGYSDYQASMAAAVAAGIRRESSKLFPIGLLFAVLLGAACLVINKYFGDHLISAVIAATLMVPVFAMITPRAFVGSPHQRRHS